ncbi:hypothetical protein [Microbacterium allomyrinae]|uniref:Uncharacterized protein n=1 Tax=Microbacterium allomyrinae TaxID=2830666 RepID=A0A9X1S213_9MICO|nr:hypothetical protein [Microbacterium allomyrinae]MCC2032186.1 hypothetical protein [Microbacterium allomyrinae]
MSIIADTSPIVDEVAQEVAHCLRELEAGAFQIVVTGGPLFMEAEERVDLFRDLRIDEDQARLDIENGKSHWFADFYRPDGTRVGRERTDEGWFDRELASIRRIDMTTQNGLARTTSGYLMVSRGSWIPREIVDIPEGRALRSITVRSHTAQVFAAAAAAEAAFIAANPAITAAKPAWADHVEIFDIDPAPTEGVLVTYVLENASARVSIHGVYLDGTIMIEDPRPYFALEHEAEGTASAREAIALMQELVDAVEAAL